MKIEIDVTKFYDLHALEPHEKPPAGAITRELATGKTAVAFLREEPSRTAIHYPTLHEDYAQYREACESIGKAPEYETEHEWLEMHLKQVMSHHAPREHWTGLSVEQSHPEEPVDAEEIQGVLRKRFGVSALAKTAAVPDVLQPGETRARALAHFGITDFEHREVSA